MPFIVKMVTEDFSFFFFFLSFFFFFFLNPRGDGLSKLCTKLIQLNPKIVWGFLFTLLFFCSFFFFFLNNGKEEEHGRKKRKKKKV